MFIERQRDIEAVDTRLQFNPVVAILGARQCGKTTLAKQFPFDHYFDLENPRDLVKLEQPQLALENLSGLIIIDEIQHIPEIFSLLRFLVDSKKDQKYLILGSASRDLIKQSSETLAGRIAYYHLNGFSFYEVGTTHLDQLWLQGMYPKSFLLKLEQSYIWRENYIKTFLERDIPQLGIHIPAYTLRRFWTMVSHYHGQLINYAEIARSFGISEMTAKKYIDILEGTFMLRTLQPWSVNIGKRLVKRPKLYFRDSGLFHTLQSIQTKEQLFSHNRLGASWEGFALECACNHLKSDVHNFYFWRTHTGAEVDLFWQKNGHNWAIEFKYMDAPKLTKSMQSALHDLKLKHLWIIYPGHDKYLLSENVTVIPLISINEEMQSIF